MQNSLPSGAVFRNRYEFLCWQVDNFPTFEDPNAPKRAKSAYMFWLAENRARLSKPGLSVIDVTRAAGAEWGTVKDKSKWEKMAAEDKKRYEKVTLFIRLASSHSHHAQCLIILFL